MNNFIPGTSEELLNKMIENRFKGTYFIKHGNVIWNISDKVFLEIIIENQFDEAYISYNCRINNKEIAITHSHPLSEELYDVLNELNNETNILLIKKTIFGVKPKLFLGKSVKFNESKYRNSKKYIIYKF